MLFDDPLNTLEMGTRFLGVAGWAQGHLGANFIKMDIEQMQAGLMKKS